MEKTPNRYQRMTALIAAFGTSRPMRRILPRRSHAQIESDLAIDEVLKRCPGGTHYWVAAGALVIRKPARSIPAKLLRTFLIYEDAKIIGENPKSP